MARSLFDYRTFGPSNGFASRRNPDFTEDDWPRIRYVDSAPRRKFKWPWIYRFIGYHLMAALGIIAAFVLWLLLMAA